MTKLDLVSLCGSMFALGMSVAALIFAKGRKQ